MTYQEAIKMFETHNPHLMTKQEAYGFCGASGVTFLAAVEEEENTENCVILLDVCGAETHLQVFSEDGTMIAGFVNGEAY